MGGTSGGGGGTTAPLSSEPNKTGTDGGGGYKYSAPITTPLENDLDLDLDQSDTVSEGSYETVDVRNSRSSLATAASGITDMEHELEDSHSDMWSQYASITYTICYHT